MEGPWFRRSGLVGYRPIAWQGFAVCVAQLAICIPCFKVSEHYENGNPIVSWGMAILGVTIFFALFGGDRLEDGHGLQFLTRRIPEIVVDLVAVPFVGRTWPRAPMAVGWRK